MSVHEIKRTSYLDISAKLRELACQLDKIPDIKTCVIVLAYPRGHVAVRGFGERSSSLEISGWLARGQTAVNERLNADDDQGYAGPVPPGGA